MSRTLKHKDRSNPPKWFKKMKRQLERAKAKAALKKEEDAPRIRKTDRWEWN